MILNSIYNKLNSIFLRPKGWIKISQDTIFLSIKNVMLNVEIYYSKKEMNIFHF